MVGRCCFDMECAGRNLKVRKGGLPPLFIQTISKLIEKEQAKKRRGQATLPDLEVSTGVYVSKINQ